VDNLVDYLTRSVPWQLGIPTVPGTVIDNILLSTLLGVMLVAGVMLVRKRWTVALTYLLAYGAMLAIWLWAIDRFIIPIVPVLVVLLFAGAAHPAWQRLAAVRWVAFAAIGILAFGGLARTLPLARERLQCDRTGALPDRTCVSAEQASYLDAIEWIGERTPPGATVLAAKPGAVFWYTGRKSVSFPAAIALDSAGFIPFLRDQGASYVVLGDVDRDQEPRLAQQLEANCESVRLEAAFGSAVVLSLREPADPAPEACADLREVIGPFDGRSGR
jgi:hypothetical protein